MRRSFETLHVLALPCIRPLCGGRGRCARGGGPVVFRPKACVWSQRTPSARLGSDKTISEDGAMAKGQKKSNKEVRKPKADKPKVVAAGPSPFLTPPSNKKK